MPSLAGRESFEVEGPRRRLADLVVPEVTRQQMGALIAKIRFQNVLYDEWNLRQVDPYGSRTAINLYGPPGTGKSFSAHAIAHELGKRIICVNYAELESKYVGETPKNIKAAFTAARESDCVLFFDEADSILGKRLTNVTQSADHGVNVSRSVMLLELDRFEGITIFATNLAQNYDGAFVRRILGHIEMPLPDEACRVQLWRFHFPPQMPLSPDLDLPNLAKHSEGLSGGDILNCVVQAASLAVQRTGDHRVVKQADLLDAVEAVRKAKAEVGTPPVRPVTVRESIIPVEEAPPEVQLRLQAQRVAGEPGELLDGEPSVSSDV
jgi:SpoVK/Ycf46/Vps4 family AAA+-type ATPase